ncbi:hemerythrin domain-containing protein [Kitasatospora sp. NPDC093558]|uniref:hemerythrin domain-containing protein n=1 Tax=Kitasatospora sp. NPDC093558 TaxID=3155201 RepID=UPI003414E273
MSRPAAPTRPDTHEMVIVHRVFRREFRLAPGLVRATANNDTVRARQLADHLHEMLTALHHHHQGEDDLVWPKLRERAAGLDTNSALVTRMEEQHARVAVLTRAVTDLLAHWEATAAPAAQDLLATTLTDLATALNEHLQEEEDLILPLVAQHLTVAEWQELAARGLASIPKKRRLVFLGAIFEDCTAAEESAFLAVLPAFPRLLWRLAGPRAYRTHISRLRQGLPTT